MKLYVFSDIHIQSEHDPIYHSVCDLIRGVPGDNDTVVFAGDVFDLLVGNTKYFSDKYALFFESITTAISRGVKIYYIQGNHDFQIDGLLKPLGVTIAEPDVTLDLGGKKIYIAHGDLVNENDYGYRMLRTAFRSRWFGSVVRVLPGQWVQEIGNRLSITSRMAHPVQVIPRVRASFRSFAVKKIQSGYDYVILGHCHDFDEMTVDLGDRMGHYINMGYPKIHGKYLTWTPGEMLVQRADLPIGKLT